MRTRLIALLALVAFGFGLIAGPHPCHAQRSVASAGMEGKMACHAQAPAGHPSAGPILAAASGGDCCDPRHSSLCENACQMQGIVRAQIPRFTTEPVAQTLEPACDHSLPLFAPPIDHIPLA